MTMEIQHNPFSVKTPESLTAEELVELFVPYSEFEMLQDSGHQFLHGHRGSGKSMMFRMMEPDCQSLHRSCHINELPYFGIYLSIKATEINQPEFERLESEPSGFILSEHVLTTKILSRILTVVGRYIFSEKKEDELDGLKEFAQKDFIRKLELCGWENDAGNEIKSALNSNSLFQLIINIIDGIQASTIRYVKGRAFTANPTPYNGALLGFQDVLLPLVKVLRKRSLLPPCPVFILLDDADNLTAQQTKILNTWVSYRSTDLISLKISTQLGYKTYLTSGGVSIESPHDFSEVQFNSSRTGSHRGGYPKLVEDIVLRRLTKYGIKNISVKDFFPEDPHQVEEIEKIEAELKTEWESKENGGYRASDDAYRLGRPEYIRRLSGKSKQFSTYRYAGFDQLVHISSGIIRFFLDPAAKMFADELKKNSSSQVVRISPEIQDNQIRKQSDSLLMDSFESLRNESQHGSLTSSLEIDQLKNLVLGLGYVFQAYLLDKDASQRRVFSFFLSDAPSDNLSKILNLGIRLGYFYKDVIGRKEGRGRTTLYILTRRLAPAFKLDPIGFSGYISLTSIYLNGLIVNPNSYVTRFKNQDEHMQLQLGLLD